LCFSCSSWVSVRLMTCDADFLLYTCKSFSVSVVGYCLLILYRLLSASVRYHDAFLLRSVRSRSVLYPICKSPFIPSSASGVYPSRQLSPFSKDFFFIFAHASQRIAFKHRITYALRIIAPSTLFIHPSIPSNATLFPRLHGALTKKTTYIMVNPNSSCPCNLCLA
jgi:hypothetical protein